MSKWFNISILLLVVILFNNCSTNKKFQYSPKPQEETITLKSNIIVNTRNIQGVSSFANRRNIQRASSFTNFNSDIKSAIKNDMETLFANTVNSDQYLNVKVNINVISFSGKPWGLLWLPLGYIGVPMVKYIGEADVDVILKNEGNIINKYSGQKKISKWAGFYYGHKYHDYRKDACLVYQPLAEVLSNIRQQIADDKKEIKDSLANKKEDTITGTNLSLKDDKLIITYDLNSDNPKEIYVKIHKNSGTLIDASALYGSIGKNITPGKDKKIIWDMAEDNMDLGGEEIQVEVKTK